jgi:pilus assembly protein CpaC
MARLSAYLSRFRAAAVILLMVLAFVVAFAPQGRADKADLIGVEAAKRTPSRMINLTKGMADVIKVSGPVSDIMVANPTIVDVTALQSDKLYVVGLNYGTTNVMAVDAAGNVISNLDVHVKIDVAPLEAMIHKLFPKEDVTVSAVYDQLVLTGFVSTPAMSNRISDLVEQSAGDMQTGGAGSGAVARDTMVVNLLKVAGEQQVMLKVKVVEASRRVLRELGLEVNTGSDTATGRLITGFTGAVGAGLTKDPLGVGAVLFNQNSNGAIGPIQLIIRALEEHGLVNTLAEPNLTAISGEQAGFLAGGEFPIPTSRDQNNNVIITYKPFGVALNFKPVVLSDERISLQLQTEVSSISTDRSLTTNGIVIPGFNVRRAATTVELASGGSLMIAGLLQSEIADNLSQLPGIKNVPILGALMSSRSFQRNESELVVIVTAYLASPTKDDSAVASITPQPAATPLARAFAANIRRTYTKVSLAPDLFKGDNGYGYLIK